MPPFSFPPPPPPPPKPSSGDTRQTHHGQRGGHHRGRGDGGRGRGSGRGQNRGGGNVQYNGNNRGGYGQSNARGRGQHRGNQRGASGSGHRPQQHQPSPQLTNASPSSPDTGTYGQPPLVNPPPFVDPNAFAQAMSFMATPAGQQSMAAFANHMAYTGNLSPQTPRFSPPQHAGQKRKLHDHDNTHSQNSPQQSSKPPRAKAAVPPPVPSFGFSLPTPPRTSHQITSKGKGSKDQGKGKPHLGLTNQSLPDESSGEEDIDEEAAYSVKLKGGGFAFDHGGEQISLQNAADVNAWIKDRKKHFPTQKRIQQKAQEAASKRLKELEFLRKVNGKPPKQEKTVLETQPRRNASKSKGFSKREDAHKQKQEELAALRRKLHESMVQKNAAPAVLDLGVGYESETESDQSSVISDSSVLSSSEESSAKSDSESEDGEAPEVVSSKAGPRDILVPPPAPSTASVWPKREDQVCPNWTRKGSCSFSHKCKFQHPPKTEERKGLYQVLVEQELAKADRLALDAIKYLGQHGYLG